MTQPIEDGSERGALDRRQFLRFGVGAAGLAGLASLSRRSFAAPAPSPSGRRIVIVNLKGGNDGLNTVVPFDSQAYHDQRPLLGLDQAGTLSLDLGPAPTTGYRLHPSLPGLRDVWGDGELAVVQKVGYPDPNLSHFTSESIYSRAMRDVSAPDGSGWVARLTDRLAPTPTGAVSVNTSSLEDFKGASNPLLTVGNNLAGFRFEIDNPHAATNDPYRKATVRAILDQFQGAGLARKARNAMRLTHDMEETIQAAEADYTSGVVYPNTVLGSDMRAVAKLVQAGFDTCVYYVTTAGYDTHASQLGVHASNLVAVDGALSAFAQDMGDMGAWDDTVVLLITEFGRRNFENGSFGTDHGAGNCMLLLGGRVIGGLYGEDPSENDIAQDEIEYALDFRSVYKEVVSKHLGAGSQAIDKIFPEPLELETELGFI